MFTGVWVPTAFETVVENTMSHNYSAELYQRLWSGGVISAWWHLLPTRCNYEWLLMCVPVFFFLQFLLRLDLVLWLIPTSAWAGVDARWCIALRSKRCARRVHSSQRGNGLTHWQTRKYVQPKKRLLYDSEPYIFPRIFSCKNRTISLACSWDPEV